MRFSIILISLAVLPLMMVVHGWLFTEKQLPELRRRMLAILQENGIRAPVVDLRYLDLRIAGDAPDAASLAKARAAMTALGPLRIVSDELTIPASLHARLEGGNLRVEGWLHEDADVHEVTQLLGKLRPDLTLQTEGLKTDPQVRWPEGQGGPLTVDSPMLRPIVENLRVISWLEIRRETENVRIRGILPANGARSAILALFSQAHAQDLLESTHTESTTFADSAVLVPFVKDFFADSAPRRFFINEKDGPAIEGPATRSLESGWLALLRPVSGGARVDMKLTLYPSEFHFPGREMTTPMPPEQLNELRDVLAGHWILFSKGRASLNVEEQARLAALTPRLLTAGPALRLLIGGHPDPDGNPATEKQLAKARADQVRSFLIEQGLPTSDVQTTAFDPVPAGTPGAPAETGSVEILIR